MRQPFFKGIVLGAVVASIVLMTGTALAGGVGAVFNLGRTNAVNRTSSLVGTTSGRMLQVTNKGSGQALGLTVKPGTAPLRVNSAARVANLNADELDGKHADEFVTPDQLDHVNADTLDGKHASDFVEGSANDFVQGQATFVQGHVELPSVGQGDLLTVPGFGAITVQTDGSYAYVHLANTLSQQDADVWSTYGSIHQVVAADATIDLSDFPITEDYSAWSWTVTAVAGSHMATVHIVVATSGGGIKLAAQALDQ